MATVIERLSTAVEAITGNAPSNEALARIGQRFSSHWRAQFDAMVADPEAPTNSELAGFVLLKLRDFGQDVLRAEGRKEATTDVADNIAAAGSTAAGDM